MAGPVPYDQIGYWSEIKLNIIREYAGAYSRMMAAQRHPPLNHVYVDAFAGSGLHVSRTTGELVPGSPLNALEIEPPFREYHFIDLDSDKAESLGRLKGRRPEVFVYEGDCNTVLFESVFPRVRREQYRRGLFLIDPYRLHLDWEAIRTAGEMQTIDMFLNFSGRRCQPQRAVAGSGGGFRAGPRAHEPLLGRLLMVGCSVQQTVGDDWRGPVSEGASSQRPLGGGFSRSPENYRRFP